VEVVAVEGRVEDVVAVEQRAVGDGLEAGAAGEVGG